MAFMEWQQASHLLSDGIAKAELDISERQQALLIQFLQLLEKWNKAFNLTSITDRREMVIKHLLDSVIIGPWIKGPSLLDVGTGAGIPGLPLAICHPEKQFTLLDSNGKKTRFITQTVRELDLKNVTVVQTRTETFKSEAPFQQIICRAYSSLAKFVNQTQQLQHEGLELLGMKGQFPDTEIEELPTNINVVAQHELEVPFLNEQRHLIVLTPN